MAETHRKQRLFGYARISTYGQTLENQLKQLRAAGCTSRNIYRENVTGARPDRRELLRMLDRLAAGDVVTVTRIDRLAAAPSTCSASSSVSWTRRHNSGHWRSRGPTPAPAPGA
jgi:DNA invertase Pin-like site-specific DNA recombinase